MDNRTIVFILINLLILVMTVTMLYSCTTVTGNTIYTRDLPGKYDYNKGDN
jgi:hypothetical protein